jgi:hypothetical protein
MSEGKIVPFIPRESGTTSENVEAFIRFCREDINVLGANLNWDAKRWDVTGYGAQRGRAHRRSTLGWHNFDASAELRSPFVDFAKAYVRYRMAAHPSTLSSLYPHLGALSALERILCETAGVPRIEIADGSVFHSAIQLVTRTRHRTSAYLIGRALEKLADFITKKRLVRFPVLWKNPVSVPVYNAIRIGAEGEKAREQKLPSDEVLSALAHAYSIATESSDVLITATAALLCCAPSRISEVLTLPADCEEISDKGRYGLRWWPAKGGAPMIKWMPEVLQPLAKEAISKIYTITEPWRQVARWYEEHPKEIYLPEQLKYLRGRLELSIAEIQALLGFKEDCTTHVWLRAKNIKCISTKRGARGARAFLFSFSQVESAVLEDLPLGFPVRDPYTNLRYSQSLFVVPVHFFRARNGNCPVKIDHVSDNAIADGLGAGVTKGASSVFTRLGVVLPSGDPIVIRPHQFRHMLNTMLQRGGAGQMDIAQWSGRKDVGQNISYDHVSGDELIERMRNDDGGSIVGPMAEFIANSPVPKSDFIASKTPAAIATEVGFCTHDWLITPCQRHRDCVNCSCHVYLKGDRGKAERMRECLAQEKDLLEQAEAAHKHQTYGADRWLEHHRRTVAVREQIVGILDDPAVPDGSIITMSSNGEYSPIQVAVDDRIRLGGGETGTLTSAFSSNYDLPALP